jgi:N6-L-threonylcarbamoyladenine synthase
MRVDGVGRYELLGETIDDAAGEAFDKSAKLMGLGYPGGPALSRLAHQRATRRLSGCHGPLLHSGDLDFSYAGLKTAVMTQAASWAMRCTSAQLADLAASTRRPSSRCWSGNRLPRWRPPACGGWWWPVAWGPTPCCARSWMLRADSAGARVHYPELHLCTDNGAMIALAAAMRMQARVQTASKAYAFDVMPRWPLAQVSPDSACAG